MLMESVLKMCGLSAARMPTQLRIGGVGVNASNAGERVAGAVTIRTFCEWMQPLALVSTFHSNEIDGACPAL